MTEKTLKNLKTGFYGWLKTHESSESFQNCDVDIMLKNAGINVESIYEIGDPQIVRLYASELIMKRPLCAEVEFTSYKKCIECLLAYAEYLDNPEEISSQPETHPEVITKDNREHKKSAVDENSKMGVSLTVAYYLSRVDKKALQELGYKTFSSAFRDLAEKLDQKPATIKNMRDEFDPYFDNGRRGWYQRELRFSRRDIFEINKNLTDDELTVKVKGMLAEFAKSDTDEDTSSSNDPDFKHIDPSSDNVTLKIHTSNYKSIKYNNNKKKKYD